MENKCNELLTQGLYAYINKTSTGSLSIDLQTYFSSDQFQEDRAGGKWGGGISIAGLSLGANASSEEVRKFQESVRKQKHLSLDERFFENIAYCAPDINLADKYVQCLRENRERGFIIETEISDYQITFNLIYRRKFDDDFPYVERIKITNGKKSVGDYSGPEPDDELGEETQIVVPRNFEEDLILSMDTSKESVYVRIPAKPKIVVTPPLKRIMYAVNIARADNRIFIDTLVDGVSKEQWNSGTHGDESLDINHTLKIGQPPAKTELRIQGINDSGTPGANPYNFKITLFRLEKIDGNVVWHQMGKPIERKGKEGVGVMMDELIEINPGKGSVVVYNEDEL